MRTIKMTTDDLNKLLAEAKKFKCFIIYDSDDNTDGEGVWHCDVELTNDPGNSYYDSAESLWSFDEVLTKKDKRDNIKA